MAGDRRAAYRAVSRGLTILQEHHATLGATDLRAGSAGHLTDLAQVGLKIAVSGRAQTVLAWAERVRAAHLLRRPVRPPGDHVVARDLTELRHIFAELKTAIAAGRPTDTLRRRQVLLERRVRDRCRLASDEQPSTAPIPSSRMLAEHLGAHALIEYVQIDRELHALTLVAGRLRLHPLGPSTPVIQQLDVLSFLLRRLARKTGTPASLHAAEQGATHAAERIDAVLLRPLLRYITDQPLVVVPTARLQALPWSLLPTCRHRPVSVAPSATLWHRATTRAAEPTPAPVLLVAGPGLPGAETEIQRLASIYPDEHIALVGDAATVHHVTANLPDARLAHLATHGTLRSDNPQFSSLHLHDGALTVYDLEQLPQTPRHVMLSACDIGGPGSSG